MDLPHAGEVWRWVEGDFPEWCCQIEALCDYVRRGPDVDYYVQMTSGACFSPDGTPWPPPKAERIKRSA